MKIRDVLLDAIFPPSANQIIAEAHIKGDQLHKETYRRILAWKFGQLEDNDYDFFYKRVFNIYEKTPTKHFKKYHSDVLKDSEIPLNPIDYKYIEDPLGYDKFTHTRPCVP